MGSAPDVVLSGAPVYTVDGARSWAGAVAVTGDRISAVGAPPEVDKLVGARTKVVRLPGRMVVPGFQDAHVHALHAGLTQTRCELHDLGGRDDYLEVVSDYARRNPDAPWILGGGWAMDHFPGGTPHRSDLDRVVFDQPVFLQNRDVHGAWVNSRALELAGIDARTPDPSGGRIERDPDGQPSGALHEHAMDLVEAVVPPTTQAERERGLERGQAYLHALGVTSWQDPWIVEADLDAYLAVKRRGRLSARVVLDLLWDRDRGLEQMDHLWGLRERAATGGVHAHTVKIFQDGVIENFTASMLDPYLDSKGEATDNRGMSMIEPEALKGYVAALDEAGFQVHFHAIGDRATREALDALEAALDTNGARDSRHHICHLQVVAPEDIVRFRRLGVAATFQPLWACEDPQMRDLTIPFLGRERSALQYPMASFHRSGATLAFGSDWGVSSPNPLLQMEVAITRIPPEDRSLPSFYPEERLDLPECLAAFTMGSAFVNHHERDTGSVEVGKLADLVVLDRNIFEPDAGPLGDARVLLTLVGGRAVYAADELDF